jgi:TonB family protein
MTMRTIIILGFILAISHCVSGQFNPNSRTSNSDGQYIVDKNGHRIRPPEFKGGYKAWMKYLSKKLKYPKDAKKEGIQGKVVLRFVLDATGRVVPESVKVVESLNESCDREAIRLIKNSPPWTPARNIDERTDIESENTYPIRFRL